MGRKKRYHERMVAAFPKGTFQKMKRCLNKGEGLTDIVRMAVYVFCDDVERCRRAVEREVERQDFIETVEKPQLRKKAPSPSAQRGGQ